MILEGTRFGRILVDEARLLELPRGLIGFSVHTRFTFVEVDDGPVAWLQSLTSPAIAFPIVDATLVPGYPDPSPEELAASMDLSTKNVGMLLLVSASTPGELMLNLLAPLVIDLDSRVGAQAVLDPRRYSVTSKVQADNAQAMPTADVHETKCAAKFWQTMPQAVIAKATPA